MIHKLVAEISLRVTDNILGTVEKHKEKKNYKLLFLEVQNL